jgi:hypothetical protein
VQITDESAELSFFISDSGIGIAADKQAELFRPFTQADASTTRKFGGTGLGLAISERLVEMMGGRISLQSEEGVGSTFSFSITLARQRSESAAQPDLRDLNVFIADDNSIALDALSIAAEGLGWRVSTASTGTQALAALKQQEKPDVIVLDWKMPDHSGLAVAKTYRDTLQSMSPPIILMVTAYSREALMAEPDADTIDGIMTKPVTPSCLYNAVARALKRRQGGSAAHESEPHGGKRLAGIRLLVVDDSDINLDVAQRIFSYEGAEVFSADDGREALDWLRGHVDQIDLVLMDIQMPGMDGYQAAREARQIPGMQNVPIVALTAGAFQTQRDAAYAAGMNAYIAKPFDIDAAVAIIRKACGKNETSTAVEQAPPVAATKMPVAQQRQAIEMARGLGVWREAAVYQQYLRKFVRDYQDVAATLGQAGHAEAQALAHKLKGVSGNLALGLVEEAAVALDSQLALGPPSSAALDNLARAMQTTVAAIQAFAGTLDDPGRGRTALPRDRLIELFHALLSALDSDDIEQIETALAPLVQHLTAKDTEALRAAVEDFDFRGAEQAVLGLLHQYIPVRENEP